NGEKCVELFVESAVYAGVAEQSGEDFNLLSTPIIEESAGNDDEEIDETKGPSKTQARLDQRGKKKAGERGQISKGSMGSGKLTISLSLDSTMDPEKLEKYLKLLRDYGAIE